MEQVKTRAARKIGRGKKTVTVLIDPDLVPEDLIAAMVEQQRPYRHKPADIARAVKTRAKNARAKYKAARAAKPKRKGVWDRDKGYGARILAAAPDWVTRWELRERTGLYSGAVRVNVDRLWRRGALLKRKNPSRADNPRRAKGPAACMFQYKAAVRVEVLG